MEKVKHVQERPGVSREWGGIADPVQGQQLDSILVGPVQFRVFCGSMVRGFGSREGIKDQNIYSRYIKLLSHQILLKNKIRL